MTVEALSDGGAYVADARILCPTSGQVCPARQQLVSLYELQVPQPTTEDLPSQLHPSLDAAKLHARLSETAMRAQLIACSGPVEGLCPTRESMNNSVPRTRIVGALRKIFRKVV